MLPNPGIRESVMTSSWTGIYLFMYVTNRWTAWVRSFLNDVKDYMYF